MAEREAQDTEVTLGTGKLLGIFLGLAVMCAVFFTLGYMLGRGSATPGGRTDTVNTVPSGGGAASKPSAGNKTPDHGPQPCVAGSANCPAPNTPPANSSASGASKPPAAQSTTAPPSSNNSSSSSKPPDPPSATKSVTTGTYMVQVAAVSRQEDAEILVAALRKKQYPVFIASLPGDPLFHIQVGPFVDPNEAEAMRTRLVNDGYNAIVKK
jgi:DedD protein